MKSRKMTASFSNREKRRRHLFSRRNRRSTSLRRLSISRSSSQGSSRVLRGGTTGLTPTSAQAGVSRSPHLPGTSTKATARAGLPGDGATCDPRAHHGLVPATARPSPLFKHPRQPDEPWWSSPRGICQWPGARFVSRPRPVGMTLPAGTGHQHRLQLGPHELFLRELVKHPVEDPVLQPASHPGVDGVPPPEPRRDIPATCSQARRHRGSH